MNTLKYITIIIAIILSPPFLLSQVTDNIEYENHIKQLKKYSSKHQIDSLNLYIDKIFNKFDLDCVQTARVYQKQASCFYKRREFETSIKINIEKVVNIWNNCDSAKTYYLFLPVRTLIESYVNQKDLYSAKKWMQFMESKPKIFDGVSDRSLIKYFFLASNLNSRIGNPLEAEAFLNKAKTLIDKSVSTNLRYEKLRYFNIKGIKEFESGENTTSLESYYEAMKNMQTYDDGIIVYSNIASPLIELKNYEKARQFLEEAIPYSNASNNRPFKIFHNKQLIKLELAENNLELASQYILRNDSLIDIQLHTADFAFNENQKAILAHKNNNTEKAIGKFNNAINALLTNQKVDINTAPLDFTNGIIKNRESLKIILTTAFDLYSNQYKKNNSSKDLRLTKNVAEGLLSLYASNRKRFNSEVASLKNLTETYSFHEQMIDLAYVEFVNKKNPNQNNEILKYSIENKNDILNSLFSVKKIYKKYLKETEFDQLQLMESLKRKYENTIINSKEEENVAANQSYIDNNKNIAEFKSKIHKKYPLIKEDLKVITKDLSISNIQTHLNNNQGLIDIFYGKENIYISLLSKNSSHTERINIDSTLQNNIDSLAHQVSQYGNYNTFKSQSLWVYNVLFKKIMKKFKAENLISVIILNDGALHNIPFETYWNGQNHLIENYDISYLTHISQLDNHYKENFKSYQGYATKYSKNLSSRLNKSFSSNDIRLSQLQSNIDEVSSNSTGFNQNTFINNSCTKQAFLDNTKSETGIIHTALHGIEIDEEQACIIFDDNTEEYILNTDEVYNHTLNNSLTILSACYSGKGKIYSGEGIRNLTRSFIYSGSKNVIASLWAASDNSNSSIMNDFLEEISNGTSLSASLSTAKRNYLSTASPAYKHPSYWGNLILTGMNNSGHRYGITYLFLAIGGALLISIGGLIFKSF